MKCLVIHEIDQSNFIRYVIPLAKKILERKSSLKIILLADSFVENDEILNLPLVKKEKIYFYYIREFKQKLKQGDIEVLGYIDYSYRIPDLYWTFFFKKRNIPTFQIQHGMYIKYLKRNLGGFFSNINRKLIYLKYLFKLSLSVNFPNKLRTFLYLFNKDFTNSEQLRKGFKPKFFDEFKSDNVFIWGKYWKQWFIDTHYYTTEDNFIVIGNKDYYLNKETLSLPIHDSACYVCQTFVEDGRMSISQFTQFVNVLVDIYSKLPHQYLQIKFHPRSNKELYKNLTDLFNVSEVKGFPKCEKYIGHYSTILSLAYSESTAVSLWDFEGHEITPYFIELSHILTSKREELMEFVNAEHLDKLETNVDIDYYFYRTDIDPDDIVIEAIFNKISI